MPLGSDAAFRRLIAAFLLLHGLLPGAQAQEPLLIHGGAIIDVRTGKERHGQAILIQQGRIVAVGPIDSIHPPRAARRVDAHGRWIIPGIIDVHAHEADRRVLARALALGITSTLTMPAGGDTLVPLEQWAQAAGSPTPRLYLVPAMFSGEFPDNVFPGVYPVRKPRSVEEARRFVEQMPASGGRQLKVYIEDGELWFESGVPLPNLTPAIISEIVRTAHARGMRVYAHAWKAKFARLALAAGVDALIHAVSDLVLPNKFWADMRRRNMPWVPTFMALMAFGDPAGYARRVLADSSLRAVLRTEDLEQLARDTVSGACRADVLPVLCRHYAANFETVRRNTQAARGAGVQLALGSDWSLGPGTHIELELLQEAGIPPADVLRAATWGSSVALGQSDTTGTIETGRLADLVVLRANPLSDIRNARKVEWVIKAGHVLEPLARH